MRNRKISKRALKSLQTEIVPILKKNGVVKAGIFGSYARGEAGKKSDLDILIEVKRRKFSLLDLVGLERELTQRIRKGVDLVEYDTLHPKLKHRILEEEIRVI